MSRPAGEWSPTVHSFLRHLRGEGLDCVPEPLGIDGDTERLSFIDGAAGGDGWHHQHTATGLRSAAGLLRTIHDASIGWEPPDDARWGHPALAGDDLVFCHGDPGPWNFVWRDSDAVALIDWDFLHPAPRLDDVAYALRWFVPAREDEHERAFAARGVEPQRTWVEEGSLEAQAEEVEWVRENGHLLR